MTGPLALVLVLLVAILAPSFYFVYGCDVEEDS